MPKTMGSDVNDRLAAFLKRYNLHAILWFFSAGVLATATHYVVMFGGIALIGRPVMWAFVGAVCGALVGYVVNYSKTFESQASHKVTLVRYMIVVSGTVIANTGLIYIFVKLLSLNAFLSQVATTGILFLVNYFVHKLFTFR